MNDDSIQRDLERDARVVSERIPEVMTQKEANETADKLRAFMAERDFSQAKVANLLNVSTSVINQFLQGKYKGKLGPIVKKATSLINTVKRKEKRNKNVPYIETTVAKSIATLITQTEAFSEEEGKIGIIVGDGSPDVSLLRVLESPSRVSIQEETSVPRSVVRAEVQGCPKHLERLSRCTRPA